MGAGGTPLAGRAKDRDRWIDRPGALPWQRCTHAGGQRGPGMAQPHPHQCRRRQAAYQARPYRAGPHKHHDGKRTPGHADVSWADTTGGLRSTIAAPRADLNMIGVAAPVPELPPALPVLRRCPRPTRTRAQQIDMSVCRSPSRMKAPIALSRAPIYWPALPPIASLGLADPGPFQTLIPELEKTMGRQKIVVLGTGGTIAGTSAQAGDNIGYTAAQVGVEQLLAAVPGLQALAGGALLAEQVAQINSKDMDCDIGRALALRCAHHLQEPQVRGLVITHGTDTLEETAWFLHAVLDARKPVVLTSAMRPATALTPDGPQNLLDAVAVAQAAGATGVLAVAAGRVHGAQRVQKMHPYRVDAFGSGDAGPLGWVEEGRVRLAQGWPLALENKPSNALEK